jgi:hypothetical protein
VPEVDGTHGVARETMERMSRNERCKKEVELSQLCSIYTGINNKVDYTVPAGDPLT